MPCAAQVVLQAELCVVLCSELGGLGFRVKGVSCGIWGLVIAVKGIGGGCTIRIILPSKLGVSFRVTLRIEVFEFCFSLW